MFNGLHIYTAKLQSVLVHHGKYVMRRETGLSVHFEMKYCSVLLHGFRMPNALDGCWNREASCIWRVHLDMHARHNPYVNEMCGGPKRIGAANHKAVGVR